MMEQLRERKSAWELYCRRGVILPGFAEEIAARRKIQREWEAAGERLR